MEDKKAVWIIRFENGTLRSKWGTYKEAVEIAESLKPERGDYIII